MLKSNTTRLNVMLTLTVNKRLIMYFVYYVPHCIFSKGELSLYFTAQTIEKESLKSVTKIFGFRLYFGGPISLPGKLYKYKPKQFLCDSKVFNMLSKYSFYPSCQFQWSFVTIETLDDPKNDKEML